jgi:hypothetical protein
MGAGVDGCVNDSVVWVLVRMLVWVLVWMVVWVNEHGPFMAWVNLLRRQLVTKTGANW